MWRITKMTGHEFYFETIGKQYDVDNYFGAQCWDLFAYYCDRMGYKRVNCTRTGYVIDIYIDRMNNGVLDNFVEVSVPRLQDGDWCVFDFGNVSHIAMFRLREGDKGIFLGLNQGADVVNQSVYELKYIVGCFRAKDTMKDYVFTDSGSVTVIVDTLNVRDMPSTSAKIVAEYYRCEIFNYDSVQEKEGYLWAHYISYSGLHRYIALCELDKELYCRQV